MSLFDDKKKCGRRKFLKSDVMKLKSLHDEGYSLKRIAEKIGFSQKTIERKIKMLGLKRAIHKESSIDQVMASFGVSKENLITTKDFLDKNGHLIRRVVTKMSDIDAVRTIVDIKRVLESNFEEKSNVVNYSDVKSDFIKHPD